MRGRYALYSERRILAEHFGADMPGDLLRRYNIVPTQTIPLIRVDAGWRHFALARCGRSFTQNSRMRIKTCYR